MKKHLRRGYIGQKGFVRGTVVKPKYFDKKLVVDLDFDTKTVQDRETGELEGRRTVHKEFEKVPVIRTSEGEIIGRAKRLKSPYPKRYPIISGKKRKMIPVLHLEHFD